MEATGRLPLQGKMSRSSRLRIRLACLVVQLEECLVNHSRATASKLFAERSALAGRPPGCLRSTTVPLEALTNWATHASPLPYCLCGANGYPHWRPLCSFTGCHRHHLR